MDRAGILLVALSATGFSAKAIFARLAYREGVDAISLLGLRMLFAAPFFLAMAFYFEWRSRKLTATEVGQVILLGLLGYYLASLFDFIGLQYITANLERLILFIYPTLVLFMGRLLFAERIGRDRAVAVLLTYAGIAISFASDYRSSGSDALRGSFFVFLSALVYSLYLVGSGRLIPRLGSMRFTALAMLVSSLAVFLHVTLYRYLDTQSLALVATQLSSFSERTYWLAAGMAILSTVLPALLLSEGVRRIGSGPAAIAASSGPVSVLFLAALFLDEPVGVPQILGVILTLWGVGMLSRR